MSDAAYTFTQDQFFCMMKMVNHDGFLEGVAALPENERNAAILMECVAKHPVGCACDDPWCFKLRNGLAAGTLS